MSFRDEILQDAGVQFSQQSIKRLMTEGAYFNKYLKKDLKNAIHSGVLTIEESNEIKKIANSNNKIDKFFNEYAPLVNGLLEEKISSLENNIENSLIEENVNILNEELQELVEKSEKIRSLMC